MSTNVLSAKAIKRSWHQIDAKDKVLGRLATEVATLLMGKNKAMFVPYLDTGDYVVITNASLVKVTGRKPAQKVYFRHSGFPGGDTKELFENLIKRRPEAVLEHAIKGMLPKTRLGRQMIKKLYIYSGNTHPHQAKFAKGETAPEPAVQATV